MQIQFYELTPEQLGKIMQFVNDPNQELIDEQAATAFQTMFFAFQRKLMKNMTIQTHKSQKLEQRISRMEKRKDNQDTESFIETGLDSLDVANALLYQLQKRGNYRYAKNKVIYILYESYCRWLSEKKERLFLEHPVATQWGPQLWRVYNRLDISKQQGEEAWLLIQNTNPEVAIMLKEAAFKYHDYFEETLKKYYKESTPYRNACPSGVLNKWNKEISDKDIYDWKHNII